MENETSIQVGNSSPIVDEFGAIVEKAASANVELSFEILQELKAQRGAVFEKYYGTPKWLMAPNGRPSHLHEKDWVTVRTENFKKWFGDWEQEDKDVSKAIDLETGEPRVYYHGTRHNVSEFKSLAKLTGESFDNHGIYFSGSAVVASDWASTSSRVGSRDRTDGSQVVYPVFLKVTHPLIVSKTELETIIPRLQKTKDYLSRETLGRFISKDELIQFKSDGYDGIFNEMHSGNEMFIVFDSNQIKSTTGNVGLFSSYTDNILL